MIFNNSKGCKVHLNAHEICVTWFLMTGMSPREISIFMRIHERNVSYYKRTTMKKICATNNSQFLIWFLQNKEKFYHSSNELLFLKRGGK